MDECIDVASNGSKKEDDNPIESTFFFQTSFNLPLSNLMVLRGVIFLPVTSCSSFRACSSETNLSE